MSDIIEIVGLKKYYSRGRESVKALDGVDLRIKSGEVISIVGPSGSGKTTLLNLISCLDWPTEGAIKINNSNVANFKERQLISVRRKNLGFIFQRFHLIPILSVKENIELPLIFAKKEIVSKELQEQLQRVGLSGKENIWADSLNGGDKQRVAIARALISNPKVLVADEPTGQLETQVRDSIFKLFRQLSKSGLTVIIATHDLELAEMADRIVYLKDGKIVSREESDLYY